MCPYRYIYSTAPVIKYIYSIVPVVNNFVCDHVYIFLDFDLTFAGVISFLKAEKFSAADAETLGVHLQVPRSDIRTMKKNNVNNAVGLYYDIIEAWFQLKEPSLEELAEALERTDYKNISGRIRGEIEILCITSYHSPLLPVG